MKRLKIFGVPWHLSHNSDLIQALEPVADFYYLVNNVRKWNELARPKTDLKNLNFVSYYEPGTYDLAILHVDQQCVEPEMGKSKLYNDLNSVITDIPKIVINHGTPMWPENKYGWTEDEIRDRMRRMIGDSKMIVNSKKAVERWGWGTAIHHGLNPDLWWHDLPKEPRSLTCLSPSGLETYYNRRLLSAVKEDLRRRYDMIHSQVTVDLRIEEHPTLAGFDAYRDFIARALVYFNPTFDSPMPRSRTEAMLSGCCIVTTRHHDVEEFIEDGVNGFVVIDNPEAISDLINELCTTRYKEAVEVGKRGREMAMKVFSQERYRNDWINAIEEVLR